MVTLPARVKNGIKLIPIYSTEESFIQNYYKINYLNISQLKTYFTASVDDVTLGLDPFFVNMLVITIMAAALIALAIYSLVVTRIE